MDEVINIGTKDVWKAGGKDFDIFSYKGESPKRINALIFTTAGGVRVNLHSGEVGTLKALLDKIFSEGYYLYPEDEPKDSVTVEKTSPAMFTCPKCKSELFVPIHPNAPPVLQVKCPKCGEVSPAQR